MSSCATASMPVHCVARRAPLPPSVRVPTLEPSAPLSTGNRMFRNNTQDHYLYGTTLSDHYQPMHDIVAETNDACVKSLEVKNSPSTVRIEELLSGIYKSSAAAMEELADASPLPSAVTLSSQETPKVSKQRSSFLQRSQTERPSSSSARGSRREETAARPAWNQNCPTPRQKPSVSAPRTEPRRVTRQASVENRSRPWIDGMKRTNSARNGLTTEKDASIEGNTGMPASENSGIAKLSVRKTSYSVPSMSNKSSLSATGVVPTRKKEDESSLFLRLDFLEKSLQDAQQRATRAEARCEDLEVSLHTLTSHHRDVMSRLEERNIQLTAQVQFALQWIQSFERTVVGGESRSKADDDEVKKGDYIPEALMSLSNNEDVTHSVGTFTGLSSADVTQREVAVKGTAVRVAPAPPMTLRFQ